MSDIGTCCDRIFSDFKFEDLRQATPPARKGVYIIRVKSKGRSVQEISKHVKQAIVSLKWSIVEKKMLNRIKRLEKIDQCPVIYIGSAGTRNSSKHTLKGRYMDFSGRHTAMYPLWALIYFGWELEYGWFVDENPADKEEQIKKNYKQQHNGVLPAIVHR